MSLPEPSFVDRNPEQITSDLITQFQEATGKTLYPAQYERLICNIIAYRENLVRIAINEACKQNLVEFAKYPMLDYLGQLVGVVRLSSKPSLTTIRFTLEGIKAFNVIIPAGFIVASNDGKFNFETIDSAIITAGSTYIDVNCQCQTTGEDSNGYLPGDIADLVQPIQYVATASNTTVTASGSDEEDDDRFRSRIKEAPEKYSNAGSKGAYHFWAMSAHQNIIDVSVTTPSPGVVNVYPLMISGNPSSEMIALVLATLNDEKIRPLTDNVNVLAPTRVDFTISADITLYSWADIETVESQIQTDITLYVENMKSKLGKDIVPSQIIAILNSIYGVYKVVLNSPSSLDELDVNEWANCTGTTFNYVGYVNG